MINRFHLGLTLGTSDPSSCPVQSFPCLVNKRVFHSRLAKCPRTQIEKTPLGSPASHRYQKPNGQLHCARTRKTGITCGRRMNQLPANSSAHYYAPRPREGFQPLAAEECMSDQGTGACPQTDSASPFERNKKKSPADRPTKSVPDVLQARRTAGGLPL